MPLCFQIHYSNKVVAIVHGLLQNKSETPSNLVARSATWSQYKHSHIAKVFIPMCPQEESSFISSAWGGRVTDSTLTVNCGFLNPSLP